MRILIDTNVLVDYISERELYFNDADRIITLCADEKIDGSIAAHSVMDAFYITRKEYTVDQRRKILDISRHDIISRKIFCTFHLQTIFYIRKFIIA